MKEPLEPHLHDEEMGVVDVELHGVEQVLHFVLLSDMPIDQVLVPASDGNLQVISRIVNTGWRHRRKRIDRIDRGEKNSTHTCRHTEISSYDS
jgi:hypothetical protein